MLDHGGIREARNPQGTTHAAWRKRELPNVVRDQVGAEARAVPESRRRSGPIGGSRATFDWGHADEGDARMSMG